MSIKILGRTSSFLSYRTMQLSAESKNPETIIRLVQYASLKLSFILWTRTIENKIDKCIIHLRF